MKKPVERRAASVGSTRATTSRPSLPAKPSRAAKAGAGASPRPAQTGVAASAKDVQSGRGAWTFLSNHAHVLLLLSQHADMRMRDVAQSVGITERAVQRIVEDLAAGGYVRVERTGRRNVYEVQRRQRLRHPVEESRTIGDLVAMVFGPA